MNGLIELLADTVVEEMIEEETRVGSMAPPV
jgi:hypothetical protein